MCRVMKRAVAYLTPYMEAEKQEAGGKGRVLLAPAPGEQHSFGPAHAFSQGRVASAQQVGFGAGLSLG